MEASEEKRKSYQEVIKGMRPQNLVYIDESGIDMKTEHGTRKEKSSFVRRVANIMKELIL